MAVVGRRLWGCVGGLRGTYDKGKDKGGDCVCFLGLSTAGRKPLLLTSDLRQHLSRLLAEYQSLQEKANTLTMAGDHKLYQRIASLEPVVKLGQRLHAKETVRLPSLPSHPHKPSPPLPCSAGDGRTARVCVRL